MPKTPPKQAEQPKSEKTTQKEVSRDFTLEIIALLFFGIYGGYFYMGKNKSMEMAIAW